MDSNFSSIENLWPQVDTCFRPFRATLKISEVEPQCTLKILQSKTCEKAKPLLMVTVHTERSSCPCFAAALSGSPTESVRSWHDITFRRLMKDSRFSFPEKKNTAHAAQRWILSGESAAKLIGCVAGRCVLSGQSSAESGGYHGENHHFFSRDLE